MELHDFPFDTQELSVEINSKLDKEDVILKSDIHKMSHLDTLVENTFVDQQKW